MRIRLQRHIRTKAHKKRSATVSPYVGIIQIRFRQHRGGAAFWVRAIQPTLSPLYASSPFVQIYSSTVCRVLQGFCFIFCKTKKLYSYVTNKNRVGEHNRGSKYAPEKESKGTKMKYEIVGIEHAVGDFTPTSGRNANTVQHYDVYRLHTLKYSKDAYGKITAVVRATPDQMGQIVADLGGNIADVPGHVLDMEIRNSFGKINLTDYEVVR